MFKVRFGLGGLVGLGGNSLEARLCIVGGGGATAALFLAMASLRGRDMARPMVFRSNPKLYLVGDG